MDWIESDNAEAFLRDRGWIHPADRVRIETLSGGISNRVLRVCIQSSPSDDFVLKQARPQLRTPDAWFCDVERIWREVEVLRLIAQFAPAASVPHILFEDRAAYAFAMTAADREHTVWKAELLAGRFDPAIASAAGTLLGTLHRTTWAQPEVISRLEDRRYFDALRLDPYYRHIARQQPDAAADFESLIDELAAHPRCLVHADFSPKNLLVAADGLLLVDFETGHYGDPAFDLGFFLAHLVLKSIYHGPAGQSVVSLADRFWDAYRAELADTIGPVEYDALEARGLAHLAGCVWARVDGKSRAEYFNDPLQVGQARRFARTVLSRRPQTWPDVKALLASEAGVSVEGMDA